MGKQTYCPRDFRNEAIVRKLFPQRFSLGAAGNSQCDIVVIRSPGPSVVLCVHYQ